MAIKIQNSTIIDDSRNIVNAGVTTVTSVSIGNTQVISSARQLQNIASLDATTTATIESAIANAPNTFTDLNVTGISTFTNGPVLVGSGTSTGTASQRLQVTGGAYVSGNVGIGTTNPTSKLSVDGDGNFTGVVTASSFSGNASSATYATSSGISTFATTAGIATFADNAGISTNLKGGLVGNLVYQSATDTTVFLANGSSGTILQSNGVGNAPSWITAAPAGAITGLTVRDEGTIVGGANSVSQLDFVGSNISVASTAGIATITIADNLVGTALSVSGITTTGTLNVGTGGTIITTTTAGSVGIKTTNPQSTLDVRGTISIGRTDASTVNSIRSVTDINSWEYGGISLAVGGQDTVPQDIYFKDDGTKMFILGDTGNDVNEYALSTAWEVNTATFTTVFSVASQETNPLGLYFKPDGSRMYICGNTAISPASADQVRSYTLSNPWDISTGVTYDSKAYTTSDTAPQGVYFKDDGLKMYVVGSTGDAVYEYSLSIAWELDSTITLLNTLLLGTANTLNLPLTLITPTGIDFNASGTKMYITDTTRDVVARFDLATPWDTTTTTFFDNVYVGFQELTPNGIFLQEDQSKAYIVGSSADTVFQYNTDVPSLELASSGISTRSSVIINNEARLNNRLYVTDDAHFSSNTNVKGTLTVDSTTTVAGTLSASGAVTASTTTGAINFGTSQTTGTLILGGTSQTGAITLGRATTSQTTNIQAGVTASGNQKTINLGTGGASGSRTLITVGSATAGAISTVTIPSPTNLLIGAATTTGTASQPLQVTGGAYVSGSVGIGTINPTVQLQLSRTASISNVGTGITLAGTVGSALTVAQFLHANTNTSYLRIKATRNATGSDWTTASTKLLQVTDSTEQGYIEYNPNGSTYGMAFGQGSTEWARFTQSGNFGVGSTNPNVKFEVFGGTARFAQSGQGDVTITHSSLVSSIRGASTVQLALGANNTESIRINNSGNVGIGTTNPTSKLSVVGDGNFTGVVTATSFSGDGSQLTGISASGSVSISTNTTNSNLLIPYATSFGSTTGLGATSLLVYNPSSGNLGIGTTNPTSKLDVLGNAIIKTTSTGDVNLRLQRSSSSGRAQFTLESESGSQIWRVGLTGGGTETFSFFDGTQNALQLIESLQVVSIDAPYSLAVGAATTTGTASQRLQVTGGAYVSGSVGIGTTNPTSKLSVVGDGNFTGVITATTFVGALTGTATTTTNIPNLTGAITSNNTTTSLGSFTSAQLATALTDETGSGANVFATSPTLVTPILGSASATDINVSGVVTATSFSGSGTNLTGIVTSIVAGTNITISGSTGQVTINSTGGGGGGAAPALDILEVMLFA